MRLRYPASRAAHLETNMGDKSHASCTATLDNRLNVPGRQYLSN